MLSADEPVNNNPPDNEHDTTNNPSNDTTPPKEKKGPFSIEPVDPLVFGENNDSPELRPAAAYVPVGPQLGARTPRPRLPEERSYPKWTPGGREEVNAAETDVPDQSFVKIVKNVARIAAILAPLLLLLVAVLFAAKNL